MTRNLLSNALRYAKTAVRVRVRNNGQAELIVTNDGERVEPEAKERIFERFFRADGHTEGTGLGLAIVRWIATAHGGNVLVRDCERGAGAEFVVRLPVLNV
jgi:signal transduction histidine kinase